MTEDRRGSTREKNKSRHKRPTKALRHAGKDAIKKAENELAVSVTVPSSEYVVGDTVIAAVYSGKELVDVDTVTAPSAYEVTLNVTKLTDTDTVKIMVWKNLRNAIPRDISQILK